MVDPQHVYHSKDYPDLSVQGRLVAVDSVARVRPRTSKGITDLLLPQASVRFRARTVPLRSRTRARQGSGAGPPPGGGTEAGALTRLGGTCGVLGRLRSRSLTELTRQIAPPTKNGHAPPPIESRKSSQSVNPHYVRT